MKKCNRCGGQAEPGTTHLLLQWGEEPLLIRDVSADVCQECGEATISAEVSQMVDRIIRERIGRIGQVELPVFSFDAAARECRPKEAVTAA